MKAFWRAVEWCLAVAWVVCLLQAVAPWWRQKHAWQGQGIAFDPQWGDLWFPVALLAPLVGPVVVRLFSAPELDVQKRFGLIALLVFGAAMVLAFRGRDYDAPTLSGVFLPMGLYAVAAFLWLGWRNKKAPAVTPGP